MQESKSDSSAFIFQLAEDINKKQQTIEALEEKLKDLKDELKITTDLMVSALDTLNLTSVQVANPMTQQSYSVDIKTSYYDTIRDSLAFESWAQEHSVKINFKVDLPDATDFNAVQQLRRIMKQNEVDAIIVPIVHHQTMNKQLRERAGKIPGVTYIIDKKVKVKV